jgi:hypothetical protein
MKTGQESRHRAIQNFRAQLERYMNENSEERATIEEDQVNKMVLKKYYKTALPTTIIDKIVTFNGSRDFAQRDIG